MDFTVQQRSFLPRELTAITGLSPTMQRDWRRNGYLPMREAGWATFDLRDVARVALLKVLADAGLGPAFGNTLLSEPAHGRVVDSICWWAVEAQDVSTWVKNLPPVLAAQVLSWDEADHFSLVDAVTGISSTDRVQATHIDPLDRTTWQAEVPLDEAPRTPITITLRLDAIGSQIASRVSGPFLSLHPPDAG